MGRGKVDGTLEADSHEPFWRFFSQCRGRN